MPDDELLKVAERGELGKPEVLTNVVRRMIADPRGISLTRDFAFQWLNVAKIDTYNPGIVNQDKTNIVFFVGVIN